jgi:uncharacterized BrkB/YihY/UPF0761 family membrane protein
VPRRGGFVGSTKRRVNDLTKNAREWYERTVAEQRTSNGFVDFLFRFVERDREADGSVTASAVSLRIFLFFVPLLLVLVGLVGFLRGHIASSDVSGQVGVTGGMAQQINNALNQSTRARWLAVISGLIGTVSAGRALSSVLATASRRAWHLPISKATKSTTRITGAVVGMITSVGLLAIIVNRVRRATGVVGGSVTFVPVAAIYAIVWFVVCSALPRRRTDRTVLLPGAILVGVTLAVLQWVLQFVAPGRVSHASQLYGALGVVVVALSWFFFVGRLFVASFALNAVMSEQFGSIATWLFARRRIGPMLEKRRWVRRILDVTEVDEPTVETAPPVEGVG